MAEQTESPSKKRRIDSEIDEFDETNPFTKGRQSDEIELKFDTGESLFVSKSFLSYASPVFETMFRSDFKESSSEHIELTEKSYDDFLNMLLIMHPRIWKPISGNNAKDIYKLAHEYGIPTVLRVSDEILQKQVEELIIEEDCVIKEPKLKVVHLEKCRSSPIVAERSSLETALEWLNFAETYNNMRLLSSAAERISVLPVETLNENPSYSELSAAIKNRILLFRLKRCDKREILRDRLSLETLET